MPCAVCLRSATASEASQASNTSEFIFQLGSLCCYEEREEEHPHVARDTEARELRLNEPHRTFGLFGTVEVNRSRSISRWTHFPFPLPEGHVTVTAFYSFFPLSPLHNFEHESGLNGRKAAFVQCDPSTCAGGRALVMEYIFFSAYIVAFRFIFHSPLFPYNTLHLTPLKHIPPSLLGQQWQTPLTNTTESYPHSRNPSEQPTPTPTPACNGSYFASIRTRKPSVHYNTNSITPSSKLTLKHSTQAPPQSSSPSPLPSKTSPTALSNSSAPNWLNTTKSRKSWMFCPEARSSPNLGSLSRCRPNLGAPAVT